MTNHSSRSVSQWLQEFREMIAFSAFVGVKAINEKK
ncbi:unnamed protein product, partial [Staurois parvus]